MKGFGSHSTDEKGYTHSLQLDGKNVLLKWGIEFSDANGFFIHGSTEGNVPSKMISLVRSKNENKAEWMVHLKTTDMRISMHETFSPTQIVREYVLVPSSDTYMQDLAISQGFSHDFFHHLTIGKKVFAFTGMERNHQFHETRALLEGDDYNLRIDYESSHPGTGFTPMIYGRTSPQNGWVVHARLFPHTIARKVIVWCHPSWNKKIPFSDVLVHIKPLVDYLWNIGEQPESAHVWTGGLTAFGLTKVEKGKPIRMKETITLIPKKKTQTKLRT